MNVIGNGVQKELKFNLQHNTTLFKTYEYSVVNWPTTFFLLIKVPFSIKPSLSIKYSSKPPTTDTTGRSEDLQ